MSRVHRRKATIYRRRRHKTWQLQEAKARFSELVNEVIEDGYHTITKMEGRSLWLFRMKNLKNPETPNKTLEEIIFNSPFAKYDLDLSRDKDPGRDIDL